MFAEAIGRPLAITVMRNGAMVDVIAQPSELSFRDRGLIASLGPSRVERVPDLRSGLRSGWHTRLPSRLRPSTEPRFNARGYPQAPILSGPAR